MPIREDNYEVMSTSNSVLKPISDTNSIKVRFNLELLKGCEFRCPGCYVNRNNNFSVDDLDIIEDAGKKFLDNGYEFNEVILGPTDFFAAYNTVELIQNKKFTNIFMDPNIFMTILTTLQTDDEEILNRIKILNENFKPTTCIEVLVIFDLQKTLNEDQQYFTMMKHKISLLNNIAGEVEYAFQINIQDTSSVNRFELARLTKLVREEFGTIVEFNPSFLRSQNKKISAHIIKSWNKMLYENIVQDDGEEDILLTMRNINHGSFSEITYNYQHGEFYVCPFIYENVFDKSENFKIAKTGDNDLYDLKDFINHRNQVDLKQYHYSEKTEECMSCPHLTSCVGKQILLYMESNDIKSCILAKEAMELYPS